MNKPALTQIARTFFDLLFRARYTLTFDQLKFQRDLIPLRKRMNHLIQGFQLLKRTGHPIRLQPILQLEPSNMCNLHCVTCATGAGMVKRPMELMPFERYCHIIDEVKDYVHLLVFWSWGEPFMNRGAARMIRYAKENGLLVHTSTNGHFLQTRNEAEQVVNSGLDSLVFAVDGLDQDTYGRYRKGGKLESVLRSIDNVLNARAIAGVEYPRITFRFIVMRHNEHQVDQVMDYARKLGVDSVSFRSATVIRSELNLEDNLAPLSEQFQQFTYDGDPAAERRVRKEHVYCHRPYANLTVFVNGDVVPCENDYNGSVVLGNLFDQSVEDILSSRQYRSFFRRFRHNLDDFQFCRECEVHDMKHQTHNIQTQMFKKWEVD